MLRLFSSQTTKECVDDPHADRRPRRGPGRRAGRPRLELAGQRAGAAHVRARRRPLRRRAAPRNRHRRGRGRDCTGPRVGPDLLRRNRALRRTDPVDTNGRRLCRHAASPRLDRGRPRRLDRRERRSRDGGTERRARSRDPACLHGRPDRRPTSGLRRSAALPPRADPAAARARSRPGASARDRAAAYRPAAAGDERCASASAGSSACRRGPGSTAAGPATRSAGANSRPRDHPAARRRAARCPPAAGGHGPDVQRRRPSADSGTSRHAWARTSASSGRARPGGASRAPPFDPRPRRRCTDESGVGATRHAALRAPRTSGSHAGRPPPASRESASRPAARDATTARRSETRASRRWRSRRPRRARGAPRARGRRDRLPDGGSAQAGTYD
jgi:hypothetical protein